ncbi:MAG: sulfatase [Acidobacteria bacterium]|nr:sulfatase [Acidobacteriota bacterium]
MNRRSFLASAAAPALLSQSSKTPPNIIWLTGEDIGPRLGCYGFPEMRTPNLDALAADGVRFNRAFTTAPVCSASRSAFMTGVFQTRTGCHHHRSHRRDGYQLPDGVKLITDRLRERGYFTCNVRDASVPGSTGKTDFNFTAKKPFDGTHWKQRAKGQPFFAHVNFQAPHKGPSFPLARKQKYLVDPAKIELPPYWPDHPVVRDEFANHLDAINLLDSQVGEVMNQLRNGDLLGNTVIVFHGDNGRCLIRGKQWLYDAGIHIPLIVRWPDGPAKAGTVRDDLVSALDITATTLTAAGGELPEVFDGQPLFGAKAGPRQVIHAARDRCDMTLDRIRCVRTASFKYIRNFMPDRPYTQWNQYIERSYPTQGVMKKLHGEGKLKGSELVFMTPVKPAEELYDLSADPNEVRNLAGDSGHAATLLDLRARVDRWVWETDDQGRFPEQPSAQDQ